MIDADTSDTVDETPTPSSTSSVPDCVGVPPFNMPLSLAMAFDGINRRRHRRDGIVIVDVARAKAAPTMQATTRGITWLVLDSSVGVMKPSRQTGTGRSLDLDVGLLLGGSDVDVAASTDDEEGNDDSTDTPRVVVFQVIASTGDIVADGTYSEATVGGATGERPDARSECETSPAMSRRCGTAASKNSPMDCGT